MRFQGTRRLQSTVAAAWSALNDPAVLATCTPGCKTLEPLGNSRFSAVIDVGVGPVKATFKGTVTVLEQVENTSYRLLVDATSTVGFARVDARVRLAPTNSETIVSYDALAEIGGKIAGLGQRVLESVAKMTINQFFNNLEKELLRRQR